MRPFQKLLFGEVWKHMGNSFFGGRCFVFLWVGIISVDVPSCGCRALAICFRLFCYRCLADLQQLYRFGPKAAFAKESTLQSCGQN